MDLFEWLKDIDKLYENLTNNAKDNNLKDIEDFRDQQRKKFEAFLEKKNDLVNSALVKLALDSDAETKVFEDHMDGAIKNIEENFQKEIENLHKLIIDEIGLDF
ncbi:hypothetical protein LCGC14_2333340 [marine sediment metagenome]|uniref:Uncharacterized protein n=1 Tax=marine sediment metagenome TaxID=412755 RepID=A0A0F9ERW2_9ZZZZ